MSIETGTIYFAMGGPENTEQALCRAGERAEELGIRNVVVASYSGATGARAVEVFRGLNVVVVAGIAGPIGRRRGGLKDEHRRAIESGGGRILFAGHSFAMLGRAVRKRLGPMQVDEIVAHVLRLFAPGVKVACEVSCMAADAGLIEVGEQAVAIGGSGRGADTALILKATNTETFFDIRIAEIVCKPRDWQPYE
jgi:hypothetical protein